MREALDRVPHVTEAALEATRRAGLSARLASIRGGTDGSRLTEMGLPTPNIFAGGNEFHSVREWVTVQDMAISAATVVELLKLLAE
jgi:tripeptide aminopeptidase